MAELIVAHTADLGAPTLAAVRALLASAFEDFTADDWDHGLGGVHALLRDGADVIAHGSVVQRRLVHGGRARRTGYVEAVAVRADARRRGHGGTVMTALEDVITRAYDLGALSASEDGAPFYRSRGWLPWQGPTWVMTPTGPERTAGDDDAVYVFGPPVDRAAALTADWRDGDVW